MIRFRACALLLALLFVSLAAIGLGPAVALADFTQWNINSSGLFDNPANWSNGVPAVDDLAYFGRGSGVTYTVDFPSRPGQPQGITNYLSGAVWVRSNTVTFAQPTGISFGPSTYTIPSAGSFSIGDPSGPTVLNTTLRTLSGVDAYIGEFPGTQSSTLNVNAGTFRITGSTSDYELIVGRLGAGTLNVTGGAQMELTGAEGNAVIGASAGVNGTVNVSGTGSAWNNSSDSLLAPLVIGGFGSGTLNITSGGQVVDFASIIALEPGSLGAATVNGTGSKWTNSGSLIVGGAGVGFLNISGGGQVSDGDVTLGGANAAVGVVNVTGIGSTWTQSLDLRVGANYGTINGVPQFGFGTFNITNAGHTNTTGDASITALTSKATVSGGGSVWTVGGELSIDFAATLDVLAGGVINSNDAFIGSSGGGTATVNGVGSVWNVADSLSVGQTNTGTLNVTGGGQLSSRLGFLGNHLAIFSTSSGLVLVDGVGSNWTCTEQLFVGYEDLGTLQVTGGGQVTSGTGQLGFSVGSTGTVRVNGAGSRWTNTESLYVGVAGTGDLSVSNGGTVVVDDLLSIGPRGLVQGNSTIIADVRNGGTVAPGVSPSFDPNDFRGTLQIDGGYTQTTAGKLEIQLGSITSFDKLAVTGHAALAGKLNISLIGGFMPAVGDMFQVLTATNGITGTFSLSFTSISPGTGGPSFIAVYSNSDVVLKFINFLPGDYNRNGIVDAADYVVYRNTFGQSGSGLAADGNASGSIDAGDLDVWRANFGQTAGAGSGAASGLSEGAVPEPASGVLVLLGCCGLAIATTRGRHL